LIFSLVHEAFPLNHQFGAFLLIANNPFLFVKCFNRQLI